MVVVGAWVVMAAVVAGGRVDIVVTCATVVGWLVGPCVVPATVIWPATVAGGWVVALGGFVPVGSSLSKTHTPSTHAPFLLLQSVPSSTFPLG